MQSKLIPISKLKANNGQIEGLPKNPRILKDDRFEKLKQSIIDDPEMLELREVIAYDNHGELVVILGNQRLKAVKELGFKEVPTKVLPTSTPLEKLKAYVIKDNVSSGEHDMDALQDDWDIVGLNDWGLEISIKVKDIHKLNNKDFETEFNKIKNEHAKTPIVKEFTEDYNAFIIICENEIDELYLRNILNITDSVDNDRGMSKRKTNVITVEQLKWAISK